MARRFAVAVTRSRRSAWAVAALVWLSAGVSQAEIVRYVDADGTLTLSNIGRHRMPRPRSVRGVVADTTAPTREQLAERRALYSDHVREAAARFQLPEALLLAVIQAESNFNPHAVSPANARGLMQLIPPTAKRFAVSDIFDPRDNILGGARYLRELADRFQGNMRLTLAAYNAGEGAVERYQGVPPFPETQAYVQRVLDLFKQYSSIT